jgi:hypothetical protein
MSLIDDLVKIESRRGTYPGPQCTVARIMGQISQEDREHLNRILDNPDIPGSVIADALTRNGYNVADKTVRRHRKRGTSTGCTCPKEAA